MDFWSRLQDVQNRWNVLEHPLYQRWNAGELSLEELGFYAGEYRHAVTALAAASVNAAELATDPAEKALLAHHAEEEASHIALWDRFAAAVNADLSATPTTQTSHCAEAWTGADATLAQHLVALYAIESAQPAISETKAAGLHKFYGFEKGDDTAYFDLHATLDCEHAAQAKAMLEKRLSSEDHDALLDHAEQVLKANWELLDGVVFATSS